MNTVASQALQPVAQSRIGAKLLNLFVSPSGVFNEVVASPTKSANWLVPSALVCLTNLLCLNAMSAPDTIAAAIDEQVKAGKITAQLASVLTEHWPLVSRAAICLGSFLGVLWSAFVLWFIGRIFLKSRFAFGKALEVAGLSGTILVLGTVTTGLLALATGDSFARPSLSLLVLKLGPASYQSVLEVLNLLYLWTTGLLAIGLSKLSRATVAESAFWVVGYWVVARICLILLT